MKKAKDLLSALIPRVEAVGRYQLGHFRTRGPGGGSEKSAGNLVSEIDVESENRLKEDLLGSFPPPGSTARKPPEPGGSTPGSSILWTGPPII